MAPPDPLRKARWLMTMSALDPVTVRMLKAGVPAAVLRWRMALLPWMVG